MRFISPRCRSATKTAAPRGLRRSAKNSAASSPSSLPCPELQQYVVADLPVSITKTFKKSLSNGCIFNDAINNDLKSVDEYIESQTIFTLPSFDGGKIRKQRSFNVESLVKPRVLCRTSSCTTIGRKRVVGVEECLSPESPPVIFESDDSPRKRFASPKTPTSCLDRTPYASLRLSELPPSPSTPISRLRLDQEDDGTFDMCNGDSILEELPFDLVIRIVCCLKHDDLSQVSQVCKRFYHAVSIAWKYHFCFSTPQREKKGKKFQLFPSDNLEPSTTQSMGFPWITIRPPTPPAPKHSSRPADIRYSPLETCPFAPPLFGDDDMELVSSLSTESNVKPFAHRILFDDDEVDETQ